MTPMNVNTSSVFYSAWIYHHLWYAATDSGEQTVMPVFVEIIPLWYIVLTIEKKYTINHNKFYYSHKHMIFKTQHKMIIYIYICIYIYIYYIYLLTNWLNLWSTVLLEKLNILQLVKKFPIFYGTRRFIAAFTSSHHLSLSRASLI